MKNCRWFAVFASLAIALFFASASYGQVPQVVGAGSSALFPTVAIGAVSADPITAAAAPCGTSFWSGGTSFASGIDARLDGGTPVPQEPGNLWVAWDTDVAPSKVCAYLSVDSIVGQRLFFSQSATGNATLSVAASAKTSVGQNKVSFVKDICSAGSVPASANVSSITEVGTTATFTATAALAANFATGASVTISGSTVAAYNGTFTIRNVTATTFDFTTASSGNPADAAGVANVGANCPGLPTAVYNAINGAHINVAFTDVRPEDGQYAYHRASCNLIPGDTSKACMGYGPEHHIGTAVLSSYTPTSAQVVAYNITGTDDLSGLPIPAFKTIPIGGAPIVVFVNTSNAGAGHLGNAAFTNVPSQVLSNYYQGWAGGTADMNPAVLPANQLIHLVEREPLSGTYNTFEWTTIRTATDNRVRSQEDGNNPTPANCFVPPAAPVACGNPMWVSGADTATRSRAIGTGDEVKAVSAGNAAINPVDSLGYAFFSLGTFGGVANIKYLNLDGNDPLYATGTNPGGQGVFPLCSGFFNTTPAFSCPGAPTFANLTAGNYKAWSILRAVTASPTPAGVTALIQAAQDQASPGANHIADFVPFHYCANAACASFTQGLTVFKSHYGLSGFAGSNGNVPGSTEAGGDMAGATFTIQAELDYNNFIGVGSELINYYN
jgi:hypothetical protein